MSNTGSPAHYWPMFQWQVVDVIQIDNRTVHISWLSTVSVKDGNKYKVKYLTYTQVVANNVFQVTDKPALENPYEAAARIVTQKMSI